MLATPASAQRPPLRALAAFAAALALAGCATKPPAPVSAAAPAAPAASSPAAAASAPNAAVASALAAARAAVTAAAGAGPGGPPPFATVIKDAKKIEGPLTLWQKEDKVWIELAPRHFGQLFLMSPKVKSGIGEGGVLGGLMSYPFAGAGGAQVVEFVRVFNTVRLQSRNTDVTAPKGTPEERAVQAAYSNSLLGSTGVVSQPHPDTKAVLVEANGLFLTDMLGVGMVLQRAFRQGYSLDVRNSYISAVRGSADAVAIETLNHYYTGSISTTLQSPVPGAPTPQVPRYLPDTRSLMVGHHYSLAPLPAEPMEPRLADPRVGLFSVSVLDFGKETARSLRQHMIYRWRLAKKDPAAELSEPVKPIAFWIDRSVPVAYRDTVRGAVLEWNKAFERIGFKNAITVEQQPDDASFDTLDYGYSSIRWMLDADPGFGAIGPSHIDPRTGEILDADIAIQGLETRGVRNLRTQVLPAAAFNSYAAPTNAPDAMACAIGEQSAEQAGYALDVLSARGDLEPDSPEAQQFVLDFLRSVVLHEVGHSLGLRHNFRASRAYTEAQLTDAAFTRENGTSGSVMEYNPVNLARPGVSGGTPFQTTLGPYDYWAIEYAYKPLPEGATPKEKAAALQQVAARSNDPLLAYGSDEDTFIGLDPETLQMDLGADPIAFASKRLAIARDLFHRQESRVLPPDQDYTVLRRSLGFALTDVARAVGVLARQIGGVRTLRDYPGSGREPLSPVAAALQRQSLDLILQSVLSAQGLSVSPSLQRRLAPDYLVRAEVPGFSTDFALPTRLLELQRAVLAALMSDGLASRVIDNLNKIDRPERGFQVAELYKRVADEVWSELRQSGPISPARRDVQREHVSRVAYNVLRPSPAARADLRALLRPQAQSLLGRIEARLRDSKGLDAASRAHLMDSADSLRQALAAKLPRVAV